MSNYPVRESVIRCAYLDLLGIVEAQERGAPMDQYVDLDAIKLTLEELKIWFPEELVEV